MFFDGDPKHKGLCPSPVPAVHVAEESYFLQHTVNVNTPSDPKHQADWRFCINCFGMCQKSWSRGFSIGRYSCWRIGQCNRHVLGLFDCGVFAEFHFILNV